jgi:hypothetical protein
MDKTRKEKRKIQMINFNITNLFSSKNKKSKRMNLAEIKSIDELKSMYSNM